ncbi:uncharacterized protein LOC105686796 [Athalia rosae]|uniref:uncharacterized protein LOC105686796 n=1 Tax=Athalia rosae TaxID=37344 RepID=UPI002033D823|nr:uncharacterized protein LOC105686796 [Athalia rosae]
MKEYALRWFVLYLCFSTTTARLWGVVEESDEGDEGDDDDYVEAGPETNEVIDPDIGTGDPTDLNDDDDDEEEDAPDPNWDTNRAIRDVAYFLRSHKFNDFDRRYYLNISESPRRLYQEFPKPPLRSLHWEVHKQCEVSFRSCLKFLEGIANSASLKRADDTVTVMREQGWDYVKDKEKLVAVQMDCERSKRKDNFTAVPFQGPIERFQWRTTASYYMCWYTMLGVPELALFGEPCDNMAYCLDHYGMDNNDPRADDTQPFACALYSFCPDPCCSSDHIWYMNDCYQSPENPCYAGNGPDDRTCTLNRDENRDFNSLIKNQLNVTCQCQNSGYEWSSRFGICVDVDECATGANDCHKENKTSCVNLPGYYDCICNLGYVYNAEQKLCDYDKTINEALYGVDEKTNNNETESRSMLSMIIKIITRSNAPYFNRRPDLVLIFKQRFHLAQRDFNEITKLQVSTAREQQLRQEKKKKINVRRLTISENAHERLFLDGFTVKLKPSRWKVRLAKMRWEF